jgi:hypothetical protein
VLPSSAQANWTALGEVLGAAYPAPPPPPHRRAHHPWPAFVAKVLFSTMGPTVVLRARAISCAPLDGDDFIYGIGSSVVQGAGERLSLFLADYGVGDLEGWLWARCYVCGHSNPDGLYGVHSLSSIY